NGCTDLRIGKFCSIADDVIIFLRADHHVDWVTTYPFNVLWPEAAHHTGHPTSKGPIEIGNDVWIGQGSYLLSGIRVGNGAVIGAGSVVTRDVPSYGIMAGNPARLIRHRFTPDEIAVLEQIRWWDWPLEQIREALPLLLSDRIVEFIRRYG